MVLTGRYCPPAMATELGAAGLVLDIFGALVLAWALFGKPETYINFARIGAPVVQELETIRDRARDKVDALCGTGLLVAGFAGQFLSTIGGIPGVTWCEILGVSAAIVLGALGTRHALRPRLAHRWLVIGIALHGHASISQELGNLEGFSRKTLPAGRLGYDIDHLEADFGDDFLERARKINPNFNDGVPDHLRPRPGDPTLDS
jgi:hypothetical protein